MNDHSRRILEFDKILESVAFHAVSPEGHDLVMSADIVSDSDELAGRLDLVHEASRALESIHALPGLNFPEIRDFLPRLSKAGSALDEEELNALANYMESGAAFFAWLTQAISSLPDIRDSKLLSLVADAPNLRSAVSGIRRYIDRDGQLKEQSIPSLKALRDRMRQTSRDIDTITARYFGDDRSLWQSDRSTVKDGRTVLPLKANFKGKVRGIIHEVSSSGQTVFIEPDDILEKNNALVELNHAYRQEVLTIMRNLTAELMPLLPEIRQLSDLTGEVDSILARAQFGRSVQGIIPEISSDDLVLKQARHPLLGKKAVPIDLSVTGDVRILIITGPNTGGKTVSLKTVGLFTLMFQCGFPLPVAPGSKLPLVDDVFCDIGDEQSIEQSLSTFSAHMKNMSGILVSATPRSQVLLDELGSGTDPEEGSAIAMAILDELIDRSCRVFITTHHGILKNYGYSTTGVENASVDFDGSTLSPTYRIIMGIPGESHAVDIASRNGLPGFIIDKARRYLTDERSDVGELIRGLTTKHRELLDKETDQARKEARLREDRRRVDLTVLKYKQKERELRTEGVADLNRFLSESRRELENLVRELREGELTRDKTREVKAFIDELDRNAQSQRGKLDELEEELRQMNTGEEKSPEGFVPEPGMNVIVISSGKRGSVLRKGKGNTWIVQIDSVRFPLPASDLKPARPETLKVMVSTSGVSSPQAVFELDVRGMRLAEAEAELERQIDACLLSGLREFSIIHGKGEGILQKGLHDLLSVHPGVASYQFSHPEFGGFGKTIVSLKG